MKLKVCKGCCEYFIDYRGNDYCELCGVEIESGDKDGWLELNQKEVKE